MEPLIELSKDGNTIIMVTHSEHDARYSHVIVRMLDGEIIMADIFAKSGSEREFSHSIQDINTGKTAKLMVKTLPRSII